MDAQGDRKRDHEAGGPARPALARKSRRVLLALGAALVAFACAVAVERLPDPAPEERDAEKITTGVPLEVPSEAGTKRSPCDTAGRKVPVVVDGEVFELEVHAECVPQPPFDLGDPPPF